MVQGNRRLLIEIRLLSLTKPILNEQDWFNGTVLVELHECALPAFCRALSSPVASSSSSMLCSGSEGVDPQAG